MALLGEGVTTMTGTVNQAITLDGVGVGVCAEQRTGKRISRINSSFFTFTNPNFL